jgi:hypothetical protein
MVRSGLATNGRTELVHEERIVSKRQATAAVTAGVVLALSAAVIGPSSAVTPESARGYHLSPGQPGTITVHSTRLKSEKKAVKLTQARLAKSSRWIEVYADWSQWLRGRPGYANNYTLAIMTRKSGQGWHEAFKRSKSTIAEHSRIKITFGHKKAQQLKKARFISVALTQRYRARGDGSKKQRASVTTLLLKRRSATNGKSKFVPVETLTRHRGLDTFSIAGVALPGGSLARSVGTRGSEVQTPPAARQNYQTQYITGTYFDQSYVIYSHPYRPLPDAGSGNADVYGLSNAAPSSDAVSYNW